MVKNLDPISHVMTANVLTVSIDQKLSTVRKMMAENQIHHIPVINDRKLAGLISATDMLKLNIASAEMNTKSIDELIDQQYTIAQVMQKNLVTINIRDSMRKSAHILSNGLFHSLPVIDDDRNLIGIITSTDLIRYLAKSY